MNATRRRGRPVTFDQEIALDAVKGATGQISAFQGLMPVVVEGGMYEASRRRRDLPELTVGILIAHDRRTIIRQMQNEFTAIIERDGRWFIAFCPEVPGANGQGRTQAAARKNLADAIRLILEDRRQDALRGLPRSAIRDTVIVT